MLRRAAGAGAGALLLGPARLLDAAAAKPWPPGSTHAFRSRPDLHPPVLSVRHHDAHASAGYLFIAPLSGPGARGPLLLDQTGEPVWCRPTAPSVALNFRAAVYRGKPVLTWWEGRTEHGLGDGVHVIVDETYREIARLPAGGGRHADLHEFIITDRGTALVTAWEPVSMDLRPIGGLGNGVVIDGIVQELELPSGRVLFEWRSLSDVDIRESHTGITDRAAYDYFHINSIELDRDGNYLVSARNTWGIYKIDRGTGHVRWRLGGKKSDFAMGPGTGFAWQHDARHHGADDRLVSLFDDGAAPQVQPHSKAMILALDVNAKRATLHRAYRHDPPLLAHALGSTQVLPNGNVLVGWGTAPYISEYTADGRLLFDAHLPHGGQNYRALKLPWRGRPAERPRAVHRRLDGHNWLFVSWNGATDVHTWRLEAGGETHAVRKRGFETALLVPPGTTAASAVALDAHGKPLGRTAAVRLKH